MPSASLPPRRAQALLGSVSHGLDLRFVDQGDHDLRIKESDHHTSNSVLTTDTNIAEVQTRPGFKWS